MRYTLSEDHALTIAYEGYTDRATPLNLTSHPYFNLSGRLDADIRNHLLTIDSGTYFEIDGQLIPQRRASVDDSPFDFREAATIGSRLDMPHWQLELAYGFDHCYVLDRVASEDASVAGVGGIRKPYRQMTVYRAGIVEQDTQTGWQANGVNRGLRTSLARQILLSAAGHLKRQGKTRC